LDNTGCAINVSEYFSSYKNTELDSVEADLEVVGGGLGGGGGKNGFDCKK
jgi:hypothetical protein